MALMSNILQNFARNIKRERKSRGITQEDLAGRVGIDRSYLSGIERGVRGNPSLLLAASIAEALGVDLNSLLK